MAKKQAKKQVNKTQLIKDAMVKNPNASPAEIAKGLSKHGITAQYVSVVKSNLKKGKKTTKRKGTGKKKEAAFTVSELVKAGKLAEELGGVEKAKEVLDVLGKLP
jgi:predicted transcriptional regulator